MLFRSFLRSQAEAILACDFFTAGLPGGTRACVLTVIEHAARRRRSVNRPKVSSPLTVVVWSVKLRGRGAGMDRF